MGLEFCRHKDVVYDDAPLVMVLAQVRFPPILSLLTEAGVAGFQAGLREAYPTMLPPVQQASLEVGPGGEAKAEAAAPVWRFTDKSEKWIVGLARDSVSLETPHYGDFQEFRERFEYVLSVLRRVLRPAASLRIGMRKINMFEVAGLDTVALAEILRPEVLGVLAVQEFPAPIAGSSSQLQFLDEDNGLMVRFGIADPEGKKITRFVLDMDYFTERPYQIGDDAAMSELLEYFSEGMTSFFHWAVLDSYLETLGPKPRRDMT